MKSNEVQLISLGFEIQKFERILENKNLSKSMRKLYELILTGKKNLYLKKLENVKSL